MLSLNFEVSFVYQSDFLENGEQPFGNVYQGIWTISSSSFDEFLPETWLELGKGNCEWAWKELDETILKNNMFSLRVAGST